MTTLRDSKIPYATIEEWCRDNPVGWHPENPDLIITGPVRLAFVNLETAQKNKNDAGEESESFNCVALFPPCSSENAHAFLHPVWVKDCAEKFPQKIGQDGQPFGLHNPIHDQKDKQNYAGYNAGSIFLNVSSKFRPDIVDSNGNPIPVGPAFKDRVYGGVWAILALTHYAFGTQRGAKNSGASFGLAAVMVISDDEKFEGKGVDAKAAFSGVKIAKKFNPGAAFAGAGAPGAPPAPPGSIIPASGPVGSAAPAAYSPPAAWPMGHDPAVMASAGWSRDALLGAGYTPQDLAHYGVA